MLKRFRIPASESDTPELPFLSIPGATLNRCTGLLFGQRRKAQVWLYDPQIWVLLLRLLRLDTRMDDHIITRDPIDGCGDLVLVACLQRVDNAQDFSCVPACRGRV